MCGKTLYSNQGFADHVQNCTPEDRLYSVVQKELVLGFCDVDYPTLWQLTAEETDDIGNFYVSALVFVVSPLKVIYLYSI